MSKRFKQRPAASTGLCPCLLLSFYIFFAPFPGIVFNYYGTQDMARAQSIRCRCLVVPGISRRYLRHLTSLLFEEHMSGPKRSRLRLIYFASGCRFKIWRGRSLQMQVLGRSWNQIDITRVNHFTGQNKTEKISRCFPATAQLFKDVPAAHRAATPPSMEAHAFATGQLQALHQLNFPISQRSTAIMAIQTPMMYMGWLLLVANGRLFLKTPQRTCIFMFVVTPGYVMQ